MWSSTGRSSERTKFQAEHPTGEEDYSPVPPRLVAVLAARRVATNTSSCVPFAEASYAADFHLEPAEFIADAQSTRQARTLDRDGSDDLTPVRNRAAEKSISNRRDLALTGGSISRSMRPCGGPGCSA